MWLPNRGNGCPRGGRDLLEDGRVGAIMPIGNVGMVAETLLAKIVETTDRRYSRRKANQFDRKKALTYCFTVITEETAIRERLEFQVKLE